jgi:hypothetical protein
VKLAHNLIYFFLGGGMGFREFEAENFSLELHITRRDRIGLYSAVNLPSWVRDLARNEATVSLCEGSELGEGFKTWPLKGSVGGNDEIARGFKLVICQHDIARQNVAEFLRYHR